MRDYEVVYIFKPDLLADEVSSRLERYHQLLTGDDGSEITAVEHWGKRQLAYPIQNELNGYYVVAQFLCDPARLPEYERLLKLEEQLLRYLVVLSEGELPTPPSAQAEGAEGSSKDKPAAKTEAPAAKTEAPAAQADAVVADDVDDAVVADDADDTVEAGDAEEAPAAVEATSEEVV